MPSCSDCGGTVIEYDTAAGNGFCVKCGTVVEENLIVNEVAFGETSTGAAMVQGSFVAQGATHAKMSGPYGNRGNTESREQTIANAGKRIQNLAIALKLSEVVSLTATRMYTLAVEHKFTKGRKNANVLAVCLYVACRQKETRNYMLIDFSDLLQVNVFELGHTYLQLVQTLNLRLPLVDPSHYISRFAALLEFGEETHKVATDAVRLVQRFDRDWMTRGRRPAGICGAALLLAARMNNFRRSVQEIIQVVKIADTTLRKRLEEFKNTPSGSLTLADFRNVWLEEEMDPPAFIKGKQKETAEKHDAKNAHSEQNEKKLKKRKKRKKGMNNNEDKVAQSSLAPALAHGASPNKSSPMDPALLRQGIFEDALDQIPLFLPDMSDSNYNIDPTLLREQPSGASNGQVHLRHPTPARSRQPSEVLSPNMEPPPISPVDETVTTVLEEEVSLFLQNTKGSKLSEALDKAEEERLSHIVVEDELLGLDEEELDRFLLSEEEVRIKERVWVVLNQDYLEAIAAKVEQQNSNTSMKNRKRRKTGTMKPRDATTAHAATAAESVHKLLKNPKYSKRINYEALKNLFIESGGPPSFAATMGLSDEKDEAELYQIYEDKNNEEDTGGMVIIEEELGSVTGSFSHAQRMKELDGDIDDGNESDDGDEPIEWEDAYQQEV